MERHDVDQAQARLANLDGAGAASASPAGVAAWPGAALCAQSAIVAPAACLPLAAPVGWDVRSKSGADTALPQV